MWNTGVFASELLGTAFLVIGVIASITLSKKFKLSGISALMFGALLAALSLWGAVAIGETRIVGGNGYGFVNPGVAFMWAIANNNFDALIPSVVGELIGATIIAVIFIVIVKMTPAKSVDFAHLKVSFLPETSTNFARNTIGEIIGTTVFFGGVALVATTNSDFSAGQMLTALTVGFSLFLGIIVSSSWGSVLNGAVGFALLIVRTTLTKGKGFKFSLVNYTNGFAVNLAVAAVIGGLVLAFH